MRERTPHDDEPMISIGVAPDAETNELCDHFFAELDPATDHDFLRRLVTYNPATWILLEDLCNGLQNLPDGAAEIMKRIPGRVVFRHFDWAGGKIDARQPEHVIAIGDTISMYHQMQLISVSEPEPQEGL